LTKFEAWKASLKDGKNPCWWCRKNGNDKSGNNFHYYGDGKGGHCYACTKTIPSGSHISEAQEDEEVYEFVGKEFNEEVLQQLKLITTVESKNFRGIRTDKTNGVRYEYDEETGQLVRQYYPCTINGELSGYKIREIPKAWPMPIGTTGGDCDPFGWFRFKDSVNTKYCLIVAGEVDQLSAFQMLKDYTDGKGQAEYGYIPVISSTNGEGSVTQFKNKYEWLDRFEKIIICYDQDEAGENAAEKLAKVLPRGKVYKMELTLKDTNEYLKESKQKEWINLFFKARKVTMRGVSGSSGLLAKMKEYVSLARISLPSFLHRLEEKLRGGIPIGYIVNLMAASGAGKSTYVDSMILHWILNTEYKVGIVSLEASEGEYGVNIGSSYIKCKINLGITPEDRLKSIEDHEEELEQLFVNEDGEDAFYIVDPDVENMKQKIEYLVVGLGCKIIAIDPIQDIFDALPDDEQAKFMKWEKDLVKREQCTIINISHSRKSSNGKQSGSTGANLSEEDMMGHSSIYKSGGINIIITRNKEAEDPIERNTSILKVTKARGIGFTGFVGEYYYDNETHQIWDKEDWFAKEKMEF